MTKKTNQRFKIGSGSENDFNDLKVENSLLKSEIARLKEENKINARVNFELKKELTMIDRFEKQELNERIIFLEHENEEMKAILEQLKEGADFLAILGQPMKKFKDVMSVLDLKNNHRHGRKYPPFMI